MQSVACLNASSMEQRSSSNALPKASMRSDCGAADISSAVTSRIAGAWLQGPAFAGPSASTRAPARFNRSTADTSCSRPEGPSNTWAPIALKRSAVACTNAWSAASSTRNTTPGLVRNCSADPVTLVVNSAAISAPRSATAAGSSTTGLMAPISTHMTRPAALAAAKSLRPAYSLPVKADSPIRSSATSRYPSPARRPDTNRRPLQAATLRQ